MDLAQGVQFVSFVILAVMMITAALGVVLFSNIVHSAFFVGWSISEHFWFIPFIKR